MARLATTSFEVHPGPSHGQLEAFPFTSGTGVIALDTTTFTKAPSRGSFKCSAVAGTDNANVLPDIATTLGRTYFQRCRFRVSRLPTSTFTIMNAPDNNDSTATACVALRLTSAGKLQLWNMTAGTQIGSDSAYTVTANTFFRVDMKVNFGTGAVDTAEARVEGVVIATATGLSVTDIALDGFWCGIVTAPGVAMDVWLDDGATNDDQGASENGYPGDNYVALLVPASDASRVGWLNGAGGTTSLFDAVNNLTPAGVAVGSATATSQIKDATSNTTDNVVFNMETYTAVGCPAGSSIVCIHLIASTGQSTTAAQDIGYKITSNPAGSENVITNQALAAAAFDTGWGTVVPASGSTVLYAPSVTLGTAPTVTIRQATASTVTRTLCFVALCAEVALPAAAAAMRPVMPRLAPIAAGVR